MPSINFYSPQTGRRIKEDNSIVNIADMIESIYNALVVDRNAGMQLSGSNVVLPVDLQLHKLTDAEALPTKISRSNLTRGATIETVLNAVTIAPSTTQVFAINPTTEKEIWIAVNCDKTPWSLYGTSFFFSGTSGNAEAFYPKRNNYGTAHTAVSQPALSLCLGLPVGTNLGLTEPTSITDAKASLIAYHSGMKGAIRNHNTDESATVTVKIIRVWE